MSNDQQFWCCIANDAVFVDGKIFKVLHDIFVLAKELIAIGMQITVRYDHRPVMSRNVVTRN